MKAFLASIVLAAALVALPVQAEEKPETAVITLSGVGRVLATPDMATISTGVVTNARAAKDALADNTERMTAVFAAIEGAGVESKDIATGSFEVSPVYDYSTSQPVLTGYQVRNTVSVTVRDIDILGIVLDAVVSGGSNTIDGLSYDFSNRVDLEDQARRQAIADAKRKLDLYTEAAGVQTVRLLSLDEVGGYAAKPEMAMMNARADFAGAGAPVPMSAGERSVEVQVNVRYQIQDLIY